MTKNYGRSRDVQPELDGSQHIAIATHPHADGSGYIDAMPYSRSMVGQAPDQEEIIEDFLSKLDEL